MSRTLSLFHYSSLISCFAGLLILIFIKTQLSFPHEYSLTLDIDILIGFWVLMVTGFVIARKKFISLRSINRELKEENRYLKEKTGFYASLNIASTDLLGKTNLIAGKLPRTNAHLKEILGYADSDLQAEEPWWENNLHPDDKETIISKFTAAIEQGRQTCEAKYRFRCKDGMYKIILDRRYIFRDVSGNACRIIGSMEDITEYKNLEKKILMQQLDHEKEMERAIIRAQDIERQRLSAELHDNINQLILCAMLSANHALKNCRLNGEETKSIEMISSAISEAFNEIRNLSHRLSSSWFEKNCLVDSLSCLCSRIMQVNTLYVNLNTDSFDVRLLDTCQKQIIYRIVQEQLMNIVKHAKASLATIRIQTINNQVKMYICDNGVGFDMGKVKKGIGLQNMYYRVESCKGKIDLTSEIGNGTTLTVVFDLGCNNVPQDLPASEEGNREILKQCNEG